MRAFRLGLLITGMLGVAAGAARGQTVTGILTDSASQQPVVGASATLLDASGRERRATSTDQDGRFFFRGQAEHAYWIRLERPGYRTLESRPFVLARTDSLVLHLVTVPEIATVEGVTVRGTSANRNYAGFLDRARNGFGRYFDPDFITREKASDVGDLLIGLGAGMDVVDGDVPNVLIFRNRGRVCAPLVVVDGTQFDQRRVGWDIKSLVQGSRVRAVEVYSQPSFVPPELSMSPFNTCGAVVIWTDYGLGTD